MLWLLSSDMFSKDNSSTGIVFTDIPLIYYLIPIKMHSSTFVNDYQLLGEYINTTTSYPVLKDLK
jgi:hypothetical protein